MPREDHLEKVRHIFGHSNNHHNTELALDPSAPDICKSDFERQNWTNSEFRHLLEKDEEPERPENMPVPRGIGLTIRRKADADHAVGAATRRIRTGSIVHLNSSLTFWFSNKQNSVSEFAAMKQALECLRGLMCKCGDNQFVS